MDQYLAQHFKNNGEGVLSPPPYICSQIITIQCQSGKRAVNLANWKICIPLF